MVKINFLSALHMSISIFLSYTTTLCNYFVLQQRDSHIFGDADLGVSTFQTSRLGIFLRIQFFF